MTTTDAIKKLVMIDFIATCQCCGMHRTLDWEDNELGLVCESCAGELYGVDIAINYRIPCGWRRPDDYELQQLDV
jgi:hypothetical protein